MARMGRQARHFDYRTTVPIEQEEPFGSPG
jgi:hypothetical protein